MTPNATPSRPTAGAAGFDNEADAEVLSFVAEMSAVQLDQLAVLLTDRGQPAESAADLAREMVARWRAARYAETGSLSLGEPWVWATRRGLDACGVRTKAVKPRETRLRHTHAVTDVRLALERTSAYREAHGSWRAERVIQGEIRSIGGPEHVPDGEVHWPAVPGSPGAGETWAIEVEINRKAHEITTGIMREVLSRTGDFRSPAGLAEPGRPRYARLVYLCSGRSLNTILSARADLGSPLSARIEVYDLPESAMRLNTPKRGWEP